ncbi:hypothetical protein DFH08DRAFT_1054784 [Mycena albidolilacea]|uniref:Uncharacterized protein n=1 Tax=Mycena albidolilacea TaxID=1033008 RepID=A0AAD6Z3S6_9AGAR|nr:hypothetical protein DFH08DRAFT_1054784 [Mycena albidolilacea]
MPIPCRTFSDTTHVSDSEPEQEAQRRNETQSSPPPSPHRTPLSLISNTLLGTEPSGGFMLETRLSKLEGEMAEIKYNLHVLRRGKRNRATQSPPSTPIPKRRRTTHDNAAIPETPILRSSLMASTPERDEITSSVSNGIQQSLRECHRKNFERDPVAPGPSGMRRKLRRRVHEFM